MSNEFPRMVLGYPTAFYLWLKGTVSTVSYLSATETRGPGEFLGWDMTVTSGAAIDVSNMIITVVKDGVTILNDRAYFIYCALPSYNFHGLFATSDLQGTYWPHVSFRFNIPYDQNIQFKLSADTGSGNKVDVQCYYRRN